MAINRYSAKVWEDTTANWVADNTVYDYNDLLFDNQLFVFKRGNGVNKYADLSVIGSASETAPTILSGTSPQLTFGSVPANSFVDLGFNITGAAIGDVVALGIPGAAQVDGAAFVAMVSNTDVIDIRCINPTGSAINVPQALYKVKVFK